jgi:hypothetical protein
MDIRIPEEKPPTDPRYQWHGPTNRALVEARRQYVRNLQELATTLKGVQEPLQKKPPPPKRSPQIQKFDQTLLPRNCPGK